MSLVWIESEKCWGKVIKYYSGFCMVQFHKDGIDHEELIENEDLTDIKEMGINYESD